MPGTAPSPLPFLSREHLDFAPGSSFSLDLVLIASAAEPVEVRGFTREGQFTFVAEPVGDSSVEVFSFALPDIPVLVSVLVNPAAAFGTYDHATLHLSVNGNRTAMLGQGIISNIYGIGWPQQLNPTEPQMSGAAESVFMADPAAGANFSSTVPANQIWDILGVVAELGCDANAANRVLTFEFGSAAALLITRANTTNITANQSVTVRGVPGGTTQVITAASMHEIGLPSIITLPPQGLLKVNVTNKQAGDQLTSIEYIIRRRFARYTD